MSDILKEIKFIEQFNFTKTQKEILFNLLDLEGVSEKYLYTFQLFFFENMLKELESSRELLESALEIKKLFEIEYEEKKENLYKELERKITKLKKGDIKGKFQLWQEFYRNLKDLHQTVILKVNKNFIELKDKINQKKLALSL